MCHTGKFKCDVCDIFSLDKSKESSKTVSFGYKALKETIFFQTCLLNNKPSVFLFLVNVRIIWLATYSLYLFFNRVLCK